MHHNICVLILLLILSACSTDRGRCLRSHTETHIRTNPVFTGGTVTMETVPETITVCDQWEYPDGKPAQ